jgi:hypothetical protein
MYAEYAADDDDLDEEDDFRRLGMTTATTCPIQTKRNPRYDERRKRVAAETDLVRDQAEAVRAVRAAGAEVLNAACARNPDRFVDKPPGPAALPAVGRTVS